MAQLIPPPSEPLYLVAGFAIHLYLREFSNIEDLGLSDSPSTTNGVVSILCDPLTSAQKTVVTPEYGPDDWRDTQNSHLASETLCDDLGLKNLDTVWVRHRTRAFGLVMTHRDGWRIVYVSTHISYLTEHLMYIISAGIPVTPCLRRALCKLVKLQRSSSMKQQWATTKRRWRV